MLDPFFIWLESTSFSVWMRESPSLFAFPLILAAHAIGLGPLAGVDVAHDLRILGVAPKFRSSSTAIFGSCTSPL